MKCKGCQNPLVTVGYGRRCVACGKKAGFTRAVTSEARWTRAGAQKSLARKTGAPAPPPMWSAPSRGTDPLLQLTWQDAERLACEWMTKNGYRDARLTPPGADGGVDVVSARAVAQVKFHSAAVGLAEIQRMYGIAQATGKAALFFSSAGYTAKALEWARTHGVDTLTFPPVRRVR